MPTITKKYDEEGFTFICPAQKKELSAANRNVAIITFRCKDCSLLRNKNCRGAAYQNLNDMTQNIHYDLAELKKLPPIYTRKGYVLDIVKEFYDEIEELRKRGHSWRGIIEIFYKHGLYINTNKRYGSCGFVKAFKRIQEERRDK